MDVMQIANGLPMWIACGIPVVFVMIQAIFFARGAYSAGKKVGLADEKMKKAILWGLAIIGAVAAVAGIAYAVYRFFGKDYLEDFEDDDFEDEFDDDFFSDEDEVQ